MLYTYSLNKAFSLSDLKIRKTLQQLPENETKHAVFQSFSVTVNEWVSKEAPVLHAISRILDLRSIWYTM
jgi:hypothetical protein